MYRSLIQRLRNTGLWRKREKLYNSCYIKGEGEKFHQKDIIFISTIIHCRLSCSQSEYIPDKVAAAAPEPAAVVTAVATVSGSVKIEEEIRTNEPIANNADVSIDQILSNSKKRNHMPKYVIRPVPKLDLEELDKEPKKRCAMLVSVFKFLLSEDLRNCALVCKDWYTATISPVLWNRMDLTETTAITSKLIKCKSLYYLFSINSCPRISSLTSIAHGVSSDVQFIVRIL